MDFTVLDVVRTQRKQTAACMKQRRGAVAIRSCRVPPFNLDRN